MTVAEEAQLYLAVVEVFRAEGHEPHWLPEWLIPPPILGRSPQPESHQSLKKEGST